MGDTVSAYETFRRHLRLYKSWKCGNRLVKKRRVERSLKMTSLRSLVENDVELHGDRDVVRERSEGGDEGKPLQISRKSLIRFSTIANVVNATFA